MEQTQHLPAFEDYIGTLHSRALINRKFPRPLQIGCDYHFICVTYEAAKAALEISGSTANIIGLRALLIFHLESVVAGLVLKAEI